MATIRRRGRKWHVQIRRTGQQSLTKSFHKKATAQAWARRMEHQADIGGVDHGIFRREYARTKLSELVKRYRDEVTAHKKSRSEETYVLNRFLAHPICRKPLTAISKSDFVSYRDERLAEVQASTVKRQMSILAHMYQVALDEWGLPIRKNPLAGLRFDNANIRRERRLRENEWERLAEAARTRKNSYVLPVMRFALATAMRRGEILGMQWDHLDRHNRSLLIPQTKNGHARTIPLSQEALSILEHGSCNSSLVFPISANAFRLSWQRVKAVAEVEDLRFHDLRHEAISRFFEMGLSVPEVALISGHRDARMLFRYTHPMVQAVRAKLDRPESQ